ncbi:g4493 [Coccomyxa elongata]
MGKGTQSAINSTEALLEVKRQTKEALLKKEQLMIEHKKALARVEAMQMLQGLQIKARELARTLKQEELFHSHPVPGLPGRAAGLPQEAERTLLPADWCCSMDADVPKLLSVAERREYSRKSLQAAVAKGSGLLPCPVPDCTGIAASGKEDANVVCNACMHSWCMGCEEPCHPNLTCEQYQAHELRRENEAVADRGFTSYKVVHWVKRCSSCGHGLEKISGCDHVT